MTLSLIVLLCGVGAALIAFAISASRRIHADPVDPHLQRWGRCWFHAASPMTRLQLLPPNPNELDKVWRTCAGCPCNW